MIEARARKQEVMVSSFAYEGRGPGLPGYPQPAIGTRNLYCEYYNHCLDRAVEENWVTFTCRGCPHEDVYPENWEELALADGEGALALIVSVMYPKRLWAIFGYGRTRKAAASYLFEHVRGHAS